MGPTLRRVFLEPLERKDGERGEKALALGPALQAAAQLTERLAARVARCINLIPGRKEENGELYCGTAGGTASCAGPKSGVRREG